MILPDGFVIDSTVKNVYKEKHFVIEFNGLLSGKAKEYVLKKHRNGVLLFLILIFILLLPAVIIYTMLLKTWLIISIFGVLFAFFLVVSLLPKSEKAQQKMLPKRIYTDGETIVWVADTYTASKLLCQVKRVYAYDAFYVLIFSSGAFFNNFICQKDLLANGTLAEFEALFEGKIVKKEAR